MVVGFHRSQEVSGEVSVMPCAVAEIPVVSKDRNLVILLQFQQDRLKKQSGGMNTYSILLLSKLFDREIE